ncbi:MAG: zf-HC2 domain-containing protein [candidate division KSB1 bacterium]|nr:zf-HC2 domain-containing protein [candidate division KSB1 bacterium]MDZ7294477.1 zf-HC2 domain-containing protein [candidate division KSB1 bacterium]MDZ7378891.1 zf-HC2 domain-containing protein [candidate division KSB1 bacterium]MDZ7385245.1 zf-HC2 domain-containing protein [candidate division KSB1 bacterium]MDZ7393453.1 zf-HC2 domain-containing protein [candidate division KSB1 bacterium]
MKCEKARPLMMALLDGEIEEKERHALERHLQTCYACAKELEGFRELRQLTEGVTLMEPETRIWQEYWSRVYNRIERGVGAVLLAVSLAALLIYAGFRVVEELIRDPSLAVSLKVAILAGIAGLVLLLLSIIRERLYFWRRDRYRFVR